MQSHEPRHSHRCAIRPSAHVLTARCIRAYLHAQDAMVALAYGPRTEGSCSRAHAHALRACAEEGLKARPLSCKGNELMPYIRTCIAASAAKEYRRLPLWRTAHCRAELMWGEDCLDRHIIGTTLMVVQPASTGVDPCRIL